MIINRFLCNFFIRSYILYSEIISFINTTQEMNIQSHVISSIVIKICCFIHLFKKPEEYREKIHKRCQLFSFLYSHNIFLISYSFIQLVCYCWTDQSSRAVLKWYNQQVKCSHIHLLSTVEQQKIRIELKVNNRIISMEKRERNSSLPYTRFSCIYTRSNIFPKTPQI